jgi:hypothetical protein
MKKNAAIITVAVVILALAGAGSWLFMSGRLAWVEPNTKTVSVKAVCTTDMVNKYNDAMFLVARNGDKDLTIDEPALKTIKSDMLSKPAYKEDPTCQAMLFWMAFRAGNYEEAKAAYDAVHALHDKGMFADSNLRGDDPLFTYEEVLFTISPHANDDHKVMGG